MALKIIKADSSHYQYFKKEIIDAGVGYIVSGPTSIAGLFSYMFEDTKAKLSFTFVFDQEAIKLAVTTFLEEYPDIQEIVYTGNQNLSKVGFIQKVYKRSK